MVPSLARWTHECNVVIGIPAALAVPLIELPGAKARAAIFSLNLGEYANSLSLTRPLD